MQQLNRRLGLWATVSIVTGSVIGSSIFMKPATMAGQLGSPVLLLLVWVFAGLISMAGAAINAEIGAMLPVTGGQFVFFKEMYGRFFAFLYGWASFSVINTASVAAIAYIFAQYTSYFIPLPEFSQQTIQSLIIHIPALGDLYPLDHIGIKSLTALLIIILTYINTRSVQGGSKLQVLFSTAKIASLILLAGIIFLGGKGQSENLVSSSSFNQPQGWALAMALAAAFSGAFAAYDGWNNLTFVAGEIKNPGRNVPLGLFLGLGICMLLYIATSEAYLYMLPVDQMAHSALVATDALEPVAGIYGAGLVALLVMLSTAGATNGNILACARVTFEMARDGQFFSSAGTINPTYQTPAKALWLHCIWTLLFVFSGSFDMLTDLFVFVTWIFYGFGAWGIFILRRKMKHADRPYKAWGYPVTPVLFVLFSAFYFVLTIWNDIEMYRTGKTHFINSVFGLLICAAGIPLYYFFNKKGKQPIPPPL